MNNNNLNSVDTFKITRNQLKVYSTGLVGYQKQRVEIDKIVKLCFNSV